VTDSSQIVGRKVVPASGDAVVYKNGENGVTMRVSANVITISGVTDPFASGDVYEVGINGANVSLNSLLAKWETVGDITYLFYQSRISTAADLEAGVIKKIDSSSGAITWAGGSDNTFNKTWALRATYSYSPLTS
jgi:hypothetical protein